MIKTQWFLKLFITLCFIGIFGCSKEGDDGDPLAKGIHFFEQGKLSNARIEIKNALQKKPDSAEAYYYLALLNEKGKQFRAMRGNLIKAVKLNPERIDFRIKLAKVYLLFNDLDDALKEVDAVLIKQPEDLDSLTLKASVLYKSKESIEASILIDNVLKQAPAHIDAVMLKAIILSDEELFDEARNVLLPAVDANKKNTSLLILKIKIDSYRKDLISIVDSYKKLISLNPGNAQIKYGLANIYFNSNRKGKAEEIITSVVKENPTSIEAKIMLLDFLFLDDSVNALHQADSFISNDKENNTLSVSIAKWFIGKGDYKKAETLLNSILTNAETTKQVKLSGYLILSKIDILNKKYESALKTIDKILKIDSSYVDAKLLKAEIFISLEKYSESDALLKKLQWENPKNDSVLTLQGMTLEIKGVTDAAFIKFKDALAINPKNMMALNFIVSSEIKDGNFDYPISLLERALYYLPNNSTILNKLVRVNIESKKWKSAEKYIGMIGKQRNGAYLAGYYKAAILEEQGKNEEAIVAYKQLLDKQLSNKVLSVLSQIYFKLEQYSKLAQYVDGLLIKYPQTSSLKILKASVLSREGKHSKAIKYLNTAIKGSDIKQASLYIALAKQYQLSGNAALQHKAYTTALENDENNLHILLRLAFYYEKNKKYNQAIDKYNAILKISPRDLVSRNNLATILLEKKGMPSDIDRALELTKTFKQQKQPYFLDTYGWARFKNTDFEEALKVFMQVVTISPETPVFRYHLAMAYVELGDGFSAISELKQALFLSKGTEFPERAVVEKLLLKIEK